MEKALDGLQALISGYDEDCGSFAPKKLARFKELQERPQTGHRLNRAETDR